LKSPSGCPTTLLFGVGFLHRRLRSSIPSHALALSNTIYWTRRFPCVGDYSPYWHF
jgi:hypothetical protein